MKSDIDQYMEEANLDALFISGPTVNNPAMAYFTGRAHLDGHVLKKRNHPPVVLHYPMEREEAERTGLATKDLSGFNPIGLLHKAGGDHLQAAAMLYELIFREFEVRGRVSVYGRVEIGHALASLQRLGELLPELEIVGEPHLLSVLTRARGTKDTNEVERIRAIGKTTVAVVAEVATFLTSHQPKDGFLVKRDGEVVTIGQVKRRINLWLAMRAAENPEGTIFAIGRQAGIPHSAGTDTDPIALGKPIVFDIYPREEGGGYFFDFTRTWCIGYAPDEVQRAYQDVLEAYQAAMAAMKPDTLCRTYQHLVCDHFEARGHPTIRADHETKSGYVHSLGHGLGLAVHESPTFSHVETNDAVLLPGTVFTVEPGLYYPERELGVRLEDTVWMRPDGQAEVLAEFPMDLVLKGPGM